VKETPPPSKSETVADPLVRNERIDVLAVTDDRHLREELGYGFAQNVRIASSVDARDALRSMQAEVPSVVVVDLQTGSSGAISLLREMQQHPALASIPVLVLLERNQDAWLVESFGATAHLTKPVETGELVDMVTTLLS
jgi:two-component system, OmpR family, response regulator